MTVIEVYQEKEENRQKERETDYKMLRRMTWILSRGLNMTLEDPVDLIRLPGDPDEETYNDEELDPKLVAMELARSLGIEIQEREATE